MGVDAETVQFWVDQMMTKKGISKYSVETSGTSATGEGYVSQINFVKVVCELGNGEKKLFDIVIKVVTDNDDKRTIIPVVELDQRETIMYTVVFPEIEKFQNENSIENPFVNYPECYSVCTLAKKKAMLLCNLKSIGYSVHDRMVPQNLDHIILVFRKYALWHGSTIALRLKKPEVFGKITEGMSNLLGRFIELTDMVSAIKKCVQRVIHVLEKRGNTRAAKKIENIDDDDISYILTKMTINDDKDAFNEAVIIHGDSWNNNLMFKYEGDDKLKPIDVKFLDFQVARVAFPVFDLSYYLYTVADKSTLDKFDYILEEYHNTLTAYLRQFDINSNDVFTLKQLKESWKKYGKFGLYMGAFVIRVQLSQEHEVFDFNEEAANNTLADMFIGNIVYQEEYDRRAADIFSHFAEEFL